MGTGRQPCQEPHHRPPWRPMLCEWLATSSDLKVTDKARAENTFPGEAMWSLWNLVIGAVKKRKPMVKHMKSHETPMEIDRRLKTSSNILGISWGWIFHGIFHGDLESEKSSYGILMTTEDVGNTTISPTVESSSSHLGNSYVWGICPIFRHSQMGQIPHLSLW